MPIRIRSIEYTEHGVNILGDEVELVVLGDGSTREIKTRGFAASRGLNDFPGLRDDQRRDLVADHVARVVGGAAALPFAENVVLHAELEATRDELAREKIARQAVEVEVKRAAEEIRIARHQAQLRARVDTTPKATVPAKPAPKA